MQTHEGLLLQLFAIFVGAKLGWEFFERLKLRELRDSRGSCN